MSLRLLTLGGLEVFRGERELASLPGQGLRCGLVVHLAVEGETTRDAVISLLWPEKDQDRARHSLSQLLYEVRQECGEAWLEVRGERLRTTDEVRVDAREFEALVDRGDHGEALDLYGGEFLRGLHLVDTRPFESWVDRQRSRLARLHRAARSGFVEERIEAGEIEAALASARRWVELEPLDDEAHHRLIELLARRGRRSRALKHFERYRRLIAEELEVEPLEETRELVDRIRGGELEPAGPAKSEGDPGAVPGAGGGDRPDASAGAGAGPEPGGEGAGASGGPGGDVPSKAVPAGPPGIADEAPGEGAPEGRRPDAGDARTAGWRAFLGELKRRRVIRVGLAYVGAAFVFLGIVDLLLPVLPVPEWTYRLVMALTILGLPVALGLAWAFDITPEGIRRTVGPGAATGDGPRREGSPGGDGEPRRVRERPAEPYAVAPGAPWLDVRTIRRSLTAAAIAVVAAGAAWLVWSAGGTEAPPGRSPGGAPELDPSEVAVFYFEDDSEDSSLGHLADGLTEDLINELAAIGALEVRSRKAVEPYRTLGIPLDSVARLLDVGTLVEGSVSRSGDRVRVGVQLTDPVSGSLIGSGLVRREWGDWFAVRDSVVEEVVFLLQAHLGREIRKRERRAGTQVEEAWVTLLRAEREWKTADRLRREGDVPAAIRALERADSLLREAASLDRRWAEPPLLRGRVALDRADLAETATGSGTAAGIEPEAALRAGLEHAERTLRLEPGKPEALELRGTLRFRLWDTRGSSVREEESEALREAAEEDLRAALEDHPWPARCLATLSDLLRKKGELAAAKVMAERAYDADPFLFLSPKEGRRVQFTLAQAALDAGETEAALRLCDAGMRRFPDDVNFVACLLGVLAYSDAAGADAERAWSLARKWEELSPPQWRRHNRTYARIQVASVIARSGRADSARAVLRRTLADAPDGDPNVWYYEAAARLRLGDEDEALGLLRRFLDDHPSWRAYIAADWYFRSLADDPRFRELVDEE